MEHLPTSRPSMNGHVDSADMSTSAGMWTPADSPMVTEANTPNPVSDAPQYVVHTQQPTTTTTAAMEKFHRIDTLHLKRKLFEAMGSNESSGESEQARSYWQYLGQFVRGKLRREEFIELIAEVLDTHYKVTLHNHLLTAILHNAVSTQPIASTPTLPVIQSAPELMANGSNGDTNNNSAPSPSSKERPAGDQEDVSTARSKRPRNEVDISQVPDVLPKRTRVREWLGGLNRAERDRLKRLGGSGMQDDRSKIPGEMQRGYQGRGRLRQNSKPLRPNVLSSLHPLAQSTGYVPSQLQLRERMIDLAKLNGMTEGVAEGIDDLLGAALDTHLDSLFCGAIEVKVRKGDVDSSERVDRDDNMDVDDGSTDEPEPTKSTVVLPPPHPSSPRAAGLNILKQDPTYELAETDPIHLELQDFHSLFTLAPQIHPHLGSAVWQLKNGIALREEQLEDESKRMEASWKVWAEQKSESDRSLELLFSGQLGSRLALGVGVNATGSGSGSRSGGNAQAGPGPRSTAAMSAIEASKARMDPQQQQQQQQGRNTPSLSVPPTPTLNHVSPNGVIGSGNNGTGLGAGSRSTPGLLDRVPPELAGMPIRPQPGPGGIIIRPGRGLTASRLPPHLAAAGLVDYGGGSRREMILRELEARKLYKVMDGRPMLGMPPMLPLAGGPGTTGPGQPPVAATAGGHVPQGDTRMVDPPVASTAGPGPGHDLTPGPGLNVPPSMLPLQSTHGPNYWPYVDPASIFRDILG